MKSFRNFMNSLSVTMGSSSMLNLLSADHVSMATSTIRVLSCSLKIWPVKSRFIISKLSLESHNLKVPKNKWWILKLTDTLHIHQHLQLSVVTAPVRQSVWSVWSCHQTAAHYSRLDAVNKGNSLKDIERSNWQIIMFAFIRWKSIGVPGEENKSKASLFKINANSLKTKLTEQRVSDMNSSILIQPLQPHPISSTWV